jgi:hypothetical protein
MSRDYVAEFQACGGKVTRVAEGVAYGVDKATDKAKRTMQNPREDTPRLVTIDHAGRSWYANNEGEIIGHD